MKQLAIRVVAAQLLIWSAGLALSQPAVPNGASLAKDVTALRTYAPGGNPGATDFDVTDRAAISNLIASYSFAYDNGEADAWLSLFTSDAKFVAGVPGEPTLRSREMASARSGRNE
jgi:hypothetical protein